MLATTHHVADILPTALKGMRLALVVDADEQGLSPPGRGTAIVVDLLILTVLLLLLTVLLLLLTVLLLLMHLERLCA